MWVVMAPDLENDQDSIIYGPFPTNQEARARAAQEAEAAADEFGIRGELDTNSETGSVYLADSSWLVLELRP